MILIIKLLLSSLPWLTIGVISWLLMRTDIFSDDIEGYLWWAVFVCAAMVVLNICALIFKPIRWLSGLLFGLACIITPIFGKRAANYVNAREARQG